VKKKKTRPFVFQPLAKKKMGDAGAAAGAAAVPARRKRAFDWDAWAGAGAAAPENKTKRTPPRFVSVLTEKYGDLFGALNDDEEECTSLAHCVSLDLAMGRGIAKEFKMRFGGVEELKRKATKVGETVSLDLSREGQCVYYMITKEKYFGKPTYETLGAALESLKDLCVTNGTRRVAMPRIGCGLDRLDWPRVRDLILETFSGTKMEIVVYQMDTPSDG
jgi:O-acetyl-ADP-ribose deacetylase (regulator of RNase III)